nr:R-linalool synthase QH5, chloroplastic-like [Ipomoea batatas]
MASGGDDPLDALPTGLKLFIQNHYSLSLEKLYDTNFPSWVSTTSANLTAHRLMGYVDGSISPPPATLPVVAEGTTATPTVTIPNPDFEVWSVIDAQLCACLLAIISSSVKNNLHGITSAAAIWSHLQLRYICSSLIVAANEGTYFANGTENSASGSSISKPQAFCAFQSANSNENWFLDASVNAHVTPDLPRLYSHTPYSGTETVTCAGGHPLPIAHVGSGLALSFGAPLFSSYKQYIFFFRFFFI